VTDDDAMQPTPERLAKGGIVTDRLLDKSDRTPRGSRAAVTCVLDVYLARKTISPDQHAAGVKFGDTWSRAGLEPRVTLDPNRVGKSHGDLADSVIHARQQLLRLRSSLGSDLYGCAEAVCGWGDWAAAWAQKRGIETRAGVPILRLALNGAAEFWGRR